MELGIFSTKKISIIYYYKLFVIRLNCFGMFQLDMEKVTSEIEYDPVNSEI